MSRNSLLYKYYNFQINSSQYNKSKRSLIRKDSHKIRVFHKETKMNKGVFLKELYKNIHLSV